MTFKLQKKANYAYQNFIVVEPLRIYLNHNLPPACSTHDCFYSFIGFPSSFYQWSENLLSCSQNFASFALFLKFFLIILLFLSYLMCIFSKFKDLVLFRILLLLAQTAFFPTLTSIDIANFDIQILKQFVIFQLNKQRSTQITQTKNVILPFTLYFTSYFFVFQCSLSYNI